MDLFQSNSINHLVEYFERSVEKHPDRVALICDEVELTYLELDERANQLAHYLADTIPKKPTIGILLERSAACYVSILAILKVGGTYVPIETDYPDERINHILSDMEFDLLITSSKQMTRHAVRFPKTLIVDESHDLILKNPKYRYLPLEDKSLDACYVIYTSGTTGKPKGVEVLHKSICHYVGVASSIYNISHEDIVYQGFSLAFDASLEEVWMAFANGATLVAATKQEIRFGLGLKEFLVKHRVSVLSTVPTLLSSLEEEIPSLRLLILGGEMCTEQIVNRWVRPGLKIMNTYGPTEATVIATYHEHTLDKPITIGKPLPGYDIVILDENLHPITDGQVGELCIGGQGLAKGYVNKPDVTAGKFIADPRNHNNRLYRTGDLAKWGEAGEIQLVGRMDEQVKLRGFRIELNEIEAIIMGYPGVKQAIVALQTIDTPMLAAYLLVENPQTFNLTHLKAYLVNHLPAFMMPSAFMVVDAFKTLSSGKVDRKSLPPVQINLDINEYIPPKNALEKEVARIWESVLQRNLISVTADFFYDLGGHSLTAATIVSKLRKVHAFKNMSLLDLYQNKTIRQLVEKFAAAEELNKDKNKFYKKETPIKVSPWRYHLCALGQFFGVLFQYAISAWQLLAIVLCYTWLGQSASLFSWKGMAMFAGLFVALPLASLIIVVAAKWLLLGKVKPGKHRLWGWFYFRWWLVNQLQNTILPQKYFMGSPLMNVCCRLLGANIGKNVFIGSLSIAGHDLISIGDNSAIGYDSDLTAYIVEDGWLKLDRITIGNNCFVGVRSCLGIDTVMEDGSGLDDLSMLPRGGRFEKNKTYSGSPAMVNDKIIKQMQNSRTDNLVENKAQKFMYSICFVFAIFFTTVIHFGLYAPAVYLIDLVYSHYESFFAIILVAPIAAVCYLLSYFSMVILIKKFLIKRIKAGSYAVNSFYFLRQWMLLKLLDINEFNVMSDSLFYPFILRLLGAKIGKRVELGEAPLLMPDLLTIEKEGFAASSVAMGWPSIYQGMATFAPIHIGKRSFVGNVSVIPLGEKLGAGGLLGCLSITPRGKKAAEKNSAWLGSPAFYLPNREEFVGFLEEQTFIPPKKIVYQRILIEFVRIIMPSVLILIGLYGIFMVLEYMLANFSLTKTVLCLPLVEVSIAMGFVSLVVSVKWLIEGKLKPMVKPLWDLFVFKNDIVEYWYSYIVAPFFVDFILGTPYLVLLLRALGSKIGKYSYIGTELFAEFDLIKIGSEVAINSKTRIQTHLYEDRIYKISTINIGSNCTVGHDSTVLYNTKMEDNSSLGNLSLLMKGETLPKNTHWAGSPAQAVDL